MFWNVCFWKPVTLSNREKSEFCWKNQSKAILAGTKLWNWLSVFFRSPCLILNPCLSFSTQLSTYSVVFTAPIIRLMASAHRLRQYCHCHCRWSSHSITVVIRKKKNNKDIKWLQVKIIKKWREQKINLKHTWDLFIGFFTIRLFWDQSFCQNFDEKKAQRAYSIQEQQQTLLHLITRHNYAHVRQQQRIPVIIKT